MTEAERLANWLDSLDYHHNDRVKNYQEAAALLRAQAEELERLRALIGVWEKNYANQERLPPEFEAAIFENLDELYESDTARAALGER